MPKKRTTDSADWTSLKSGTSKKSSRRKPISWRALGRRVWVWTKRVCAVAALVDEALDRQIVAGGKLHALEEGHRICCRLWRKQTDEMPKIGTTKS